MSRVIPPDAAGAIPRPPVPIDGAPGPGPVDNPPQLFFSHVEIGQRLTQVLAWEFSIEALDQRHRLIAGQVRIAHFMRGVGGGAPDAELDIGEVVMESVELSSRLAYLEYVPSDRPSGFAWKPVCSTA